VQSLNNVQIAELGFKKKKDVVPSNVTVEYNFAITVEELHALMEIAREDYD
jgi:hypothetical protein